MSAALLKVQGLSTGVQKDERCVPVLDDISFELNPGQTLGLVGESGCGKSLTALSIMGLLPKPGLRQLAGDIVLQDTLLTPDDSHTIRQLRGTQMAMVFQDPMTALNPVHRIGDQIAEMLKLHKPDLTRQAITQRTLDLLREVEIPDPEQASKAWPHQFSGGMRQRVVIAIALACRPQLLIADEPTTALDVTIQAEILKLLQRLQREHQMAVLLITHDLAVVAQNCSHVAVMYAGQIVEKGLTADVMKEPLHPYTAALLASIPARGKRLQRLISLPGQVPEPEQYTASCRFFGRCQYAQPQCSATSSSLIDISQDIDVSTDTEDTRQQAQVRCIRWQEWRND